MDIRAVRTQGNGCKGLVFRAHVSRYVSGGRICERRELRLLKRESCPGCKECGWIFDSQAEDLSNGCGVSLDNLEDGALYRLTGSGTPDHETGIVDWIEWDLSKVDIGA